MPRRIEEMEHQASADGPIAVYREYAASPALRPYVRALAWYGPTDSGHFGRRPTRELFVVSDGQLTPSFADAHTSLIFSLGVSHGPKGWQPCSATDATAVGAMTRATQPPRADRLAMVGVYLRPRGCAALLGLPATELTDRIVSLTELWRG